MTKKSSTDKKLQKKTKKSKEITSEETIEETTEENTKDITDTKDKSNGSTTHEIDDSKKKGNILLRAKKKAAGGALGKKAFNKFADKETKELLNLIRIIVSRDKGDEYGTFVKRSIKVILIKILLLGQSEKITQEDFSEIFRLFRRTCSLVKNIWRQQSINGEKGVLEEPQIVRIRELGVDIQNMCVEVLSQHLSGKTISKICEILEYFCSESFLIHAFLDPDFEKLVVILAYFLEH